MSDVASQYSIRDMSIPPPPATSSAASSGLAPMVTGDQPLAPNMVYTIPLPLSLVFFPKDVIDEAKTLNTVATIQYLLEISKYLLNTYPFFKKIST